VRYELELVPSGERHQLPKERLVPSSWYEVLLHRFGGKAQEHFGALYLDRDYNCLGYVLIAIGTSEYFIAEISLVLVPAIRLGARGMVLFHNHPGALSGEYLRPSKDDIQLTRRIRDAARLIHCYLLDHVILGQISFRSIADEAGLERSYPPSALG